MQAKIRDTLTGGYLMYKAVPWAFRNQGHRAHDVTGRHAQFFEVPSPRAANAVKCHLEGLAESSSNQGNVGFGLVHERQLCALWHEMGSQDTRKAVSFEQESFN